MIRRPTEDVPSPYPTEPFVSEDEEQFEFESEDVGVMRTTEDDETSDRGNDVPHVRGQDYDGEGGRIDADEAMPTPTVADSEIVEDVETTSSTTPTPTTGKPTTDSPTTGKPTTNSPTTGKPT